MGRVGEDVPTTTGVHAGDDLPTVHAGGDLPGSGVGDHLPGGSADHLPGGHVGDHMPTNDLTAPHRTGHGDTPSTNGTHPDTPSTTDHPNGTGQSDGPGTGGTHPDEPGTGGGHHEPPSTGAAIRRVWMMRPRRATTCPRMTPRIQMTCNPAPAARSGASALPSR